MNEIDTTAAVTGDVDVDDVEAHGIKEVMVGLSAAAVLTGGVAAVVNSGDGGGSTGRATISADALDTDLSDADLASSTSGASDAVRGAGGTAAHVAVDDASVLGTRVSGSTVEADADDDVAAPTFLGSRMDRIDAAVDATWDDTVEWSRQVRNDAIGTTRQAVTDVRTVAHNAPTTVDRAVQATVNTPSINETLTQARSTLRGAGAEARKQLDATIVLTGDLVRGVEGTATTTIARIQPAAGASFDAATASGWVTVSAGGQEIARAQLQDGQATLTYQAPSADVPLTVSLAGSDLITAPPVTL